MTQDQLRILIQSALAAGCGGFITWVLNQIIQWKAEDNKPISAKTKRRVALLLCAVIPTALYLICWLLSWNSYQLGENLAYIVAAFTSSTMLHGETSLPNGAQERLMSVGLIERK